MTKNCMCLKEEEMDCVLRWIMNLDEERCKECACLAEKTFPNPDKTATFLGFVMCAVNECR